MELATGVDGEFSDVDEAAYQVHLFFRFFFSDWVREPSRQRLTVATTGLHEASYLVLRRLGDAGPTSVSELARTLNLDPSTINRQVRPLRDGGLVEPRQGVVGRTTALRVTEAGRAMLDRMDLVQVRDWERVIHALPEPRRQLLGTILEELKVAMVAATATRDG